MAIDNKPLYMEHLGYTAARDQQMIAMLVGFNYSSPSTEVGDSGATDQLLDQISSTPEYGVFPPLDSLKVYQGSTATEFRVSPGVCILPFTADLAGNTTEARAILAAINGTYFSGTLTPTGSGTRTDLIYAKASTAVYDTTLWERNTGTGIAKITTSDAHGFRVGDTVTVTSSGVTNGSYTITAVTSTSPHTFSFANAGATQTSTVITGKAYVPFSIGVVEGSVAIPAGTIGIPLASVLVGTAGMSGSTPLTDLRQFVAAPGGIHYRETNSVDQTVFNGKVQYNVSTGALEVYDRSTTPFGGTAGWRTLYKASTGHHDSVVTDASSAALHHTLGTDANQAASGTHTHEGLALVRPTRLWATSQGTVGNPAVSIGLSGTQELSGIYLEDNEPKFSLNSGTGGIFALKKSANKSINSGKVTVSDTWTLVNDDDDSYLYYNNFTFSVTGAVATDTVILTAEYDSGSPTVGPLITHIISVAAGVITGRVSTLPKFTITGGGNDIDFNTTLPTLNVKVHYIVLPYGDSSGEYHMWEK